MLGASIGDIAGSRFEWDNIKVKEFEFFSRWTSFTDDTVMTVAVAKALLESRPNYQNLSENVIKYMQEFGCKYTHRGYGSHFGQWLHTPNPQPYNSWGNGAAMRVSACGFIGKDMDEVKELSRIVTEVSHNHPEGLKGAEAVATAIYLARTGHSKEAIRGFVEKYYYNLDFTLDEIRPSYHFDVSCQGSVPQAIEAFLEADTFEDAIRNAISIGGDSDTIAAITGGIAEAYFGIPEEMKIKAKTYMDEDMIKIIDEFYATIQDRTLDRFIYAQSKNYAEALEEIEEGHKQTHWIWYVFPQVVGLGRSETANFYSIRSKEEGRAYLKNSLLGPRLRKITHALLKHKDENIENIMGTIDAMKLKSCMTLFDALSPNDIFAEVLSTFYQNQRCQKTLEFLEK